MSGADLPNIVIRYAWDDGKPAGPIYRSPHEARDAHDDNARHPLLRLFVDPGGKIVHSELA